MNTVQGYEGMLAHMRTNKTYNEYELMELNKEILNTGLCNAIRERLLVNNVSYADVAEYVEMPYQTFMGKLRGDSAFTLTELAKVCFASGLDIRIEIVPHETVNV